MLSVGPNSMPCQLMVGFFAYAQSLDIHVDKKELEGNFYQLVLHIIFSSTIFVFLLIIIPDPHIAPTLTHAVGPTSCSMLLNN